MLPKPFLALHDPSSWIAHVLRGLLNRDEFPEYDAVEKVLNCLLGFGVFS